MKTALITGITGQGGTYLASHLLSQGYRVIGTTRDIQQLNKVNLEKLKIIDRVSIRGLDLTQRQSALDLIDETRPNEIYHLASTSSVARSFKEPAQTIQSITQTTVNLLDSIRQIDDSIACFVATSTEMFGHCDKAVNVHTPHSPVSPYGIGKSCAHFQARNFREAYGLFVCSGVLSNFESPLRPPNYVTSKIIESACKVVLGELENVALGNLSVRRDWGSAPDFMQAAHLSLQQEQPRDYLIATGKTHSLLEFLDVVFTLLSLDYRDYLIVNESLLRPLDIPQTLCDPSDTKKHLDWSAGTPFKEMIANMLKVALTQHAGVERAESILGPTLSNVTPLSAAT